MKPYAHGGDVYSNKITYDFSANINPLGMPDSVKAVLRNNIELFSQYPDPVCRRLTERLAEYEQVPASDIVCGNGAAELLYQMLYVKRPGKVLLPVPSFVEYEKAILECGGEIIYYERKPQQHFRLDHDLLTFLKTSGADMLILCNPNNPTGDLIAPALMEHILDFCTGKGITVVIDECFMEFVEDYQSLQLRHLQDNIIVLKAFTKLYAMAGLRLGYLICADTALNESIRQMGQCWNVSVPAQLAGAAALPETEYREKTRALIATERNWLSERLLELGCEVIPSAANFILFHSDVELTKPLLDLEIAIRDCENYRGLGPGYYRIAVRTHGENEVLIQKMREIFAG